MVIRERASDMENQELRGDQHVASSSDTPLKADAFKLSDDEKIKQIQKKFAEIMDILGLDLTDDSLSGTPYRVAKMYVKEIFSGLNPANKPSVKMFENKYEYKRMLVEKNITVHTSCEHHFLPIFGRAHVGYISTGKVIGLSKLNRIVSYYSKRPQVQERMTQQIGNELKKALQSDDVAILIDAAHLCVSSRGIQDTNSSTITSFYSGKFDEEETRREFLNHVYFSNHSPKI